MHNVIVHIIPVWRLLALTRWGAVEEEPGGEGCFLTDTKKDCYKE